MKHPLWVITGLIITVAILFSGPALGFRTIGTDSQLDTNVLRIDEGSHLGSIVPDVEITTASGSTTLFEVIGNEPVVLLLAYYTCGHTCPISIQALADLELDAATNSYQVLVLSFDHNDNQMTMGHVMKNLGEVPENWTFGLLSEEASQTITSSVGFRFFFSEPDQTFVHPAATVFLSPKGEITRYLYGTDLDPADVELALIESRDRKPRLNEIVEMLKLTCFHFDRSKSRYVIHPAIWFGGAGFGVLGLVGIAALAYRREPTGEM